MKSIKFLIKILTTLIILAIMQILLFQNRSFAEGNKLSLLQRITNTNKYIMLNYKTNRRRNCAG